MAPTQGAKSILLADDEPLVRTLMLTILQEAGHNVIVAANGRDGLQKSRQFEGIIHLLVSDVQMPSMTGIELATQIQIDRPEIRVLLMSGMTSGMLLLKEGWQFLPKPFTCNLLEERIRHLLRESDKPESGCNSGEEGQSGQIRRVKGKAGLAT